MMCAMMESNDVCTPEVCTCGIAMDSRELSDIWRARAMPIIIRLMKHGHRPDILRMERTMKLLSLLERGRTRYPEAYARQDVSSHHALTCQYRYPGRVLCRTPRS